MKTHKKQMKTHTTTYENEYKQMIGAAPGGYKKNVTKNTYKQNNGQNDEICDTGENFSVQ